MDILYLAGPSYDILSVLYLLSSQIRKSVMLVLRLVHVETQIRHSMCLLELCVHPAFCVQPKGFLLERVLDR
jgi:hypothetical protein